MARKRDRIFALGGALLFLVTTSAFAILVVLQMYRDSHNKNSATTTPASSSQASCQDTATEPTLPTPEAYKPDGPVTALGITDIQPGTGAAAKTGACLVMKYYGTLATNGTMFDQNFDKPTAFAFPLGQGQVIQGWDKGLVGMKVGGTRRLVIPAAMAYGAQSPSATIPANSDLVFVVKLIRITK